jgi:hypothetical protein
MSGMRWPSNMKPGFNSVAVSRSWASVILRTWSKAAMRIIVSWLLASTGHPRKQCRCNFASLMYPAIKVAHLLRGWLGDAVGTEYPQHDFSRR